MQDQKEQQGQEINAQEPNVMEQLEELKQVQGINDDLVNIPDELEVSGKKILIISRPMGKMVEIDKEIFNLQQLIFTEDEEDEAIELTDNKFWDNAFNKEYVIMSQIYKIVAKIIENNKFTNKLDKTLENWVEWNVSPEDASTIIDMYNNKCTKISSVVKKIQEARQL